MDFLNELEHRQIAKDDHGRLWLYLSRLSQATKDRFGPHSFDEETIAKLCLGNHESCEGYVSLYNDQVIAYFVVKMGYNPGELPRFLNYDHAIESTDYTFAPSVADEFQSQGVGNQLYQYVEQVLLYREAKKIVLWGGVQGTNERAIHFYEKQGFQELGRFEYSGENIDMVKYLRI